MQSVEWTLKERAGRIYRQLLLLHRIFDRQSDAESDWSGSAPPIGNVALCDAIREVLEELTDHACTLMTAPFPISEWRPGDGPDDERWRALTEIERRELLALVARYEDLIAWSEERAAGAGEGLAVSGAGRATPGPFRRREAEEYLQAQRIELGRFRKEMTFLQRRRGVTGL